MDEITEINVGT